MKQKVTCLIPAHNEGTSISETLHEISEAIGEVFDLTIFVSEDGSTDDTRLKILNTKQEIASVEILLSEESDRLGYSKAVQRGIGIAKSEIIWFMDSDGQYLPKDVLNLIQNLTKGSIVIGYRNPRKDNFIRRIQSRLFGFVYRLYGFPKLRDPSSPFILAYLEDVAFISKCSFYLNYGFWWEFQARIASKGLKVVEMPVTHRVRSSGQTQVYKITKMPGLIFSHLIGLRKLKNELRVKAKRIGATG